MGFLDRFRKHSQSEELKRPIDKPDSGLPGSNGDQCKQVSECADRQRAAIRGRVVGVESTAEPLQFVARIDDGSAEISLVWLGRGSVPGVQKGAILTAEGTVGRGKHKEKRILEPKFTIEAGSK